MDHKDLSSQLFAPGQAYTAISRCSKWDHFQIINLNRNSFIVDPNVIEEYACLKQAAYIRTTPFHKNNSAIHIVI